jgi:hypothetical protein
MGKAVCAHPPGSEWWTRAVSSAYLTTVLHPLPLTPLKCFLSYP